MYRPTRNLLHPAPQLLHLAAHHRPISGVPPALELLVLVGPDPFVAVVLIAVGPGVGAVVDAAVDVFALVGVLLEVSDDALAGDGVVPSVLVVAVLLEKAEGVGGRQRRQRGCLSVRRWTCVSQRCC